MFWCYYNFNHKAIIYIYIYMFFIFLLDLIEIVDIYIRFEAIMKIFKINKREVAAI